MVVIEMPLTEDRLVYKFDQLVADGIVQYSSTQRAARFEDQGFPMELIVSPALAAKPQLGEALDSRFKRSAPATPKIPSPSDIDVSGHEIGTVNDGTHLLAYNKFCGYRPHLMLLTDDPTRKQTSDLGTDDIAASWLTINSLSSPSKEYIAMFNCGAKSGCSRMHKHVQVLPRPDDFVLWPDLVGWERPPISFKFYEEALCPRISARAVARICAELVRQARDENKDLVEEGGHFPHNVIITRHWIIVVPRRAHAFNGVSMNAVGFLGMSWGASDDYVRRWQEVGPLNAMEGCGVSAGDWKPASSPTDQHGVVSFHQSPRLT